MENTTVSDQLLEVDGLYVSFPTPRGVVRAVNGISYRVRRGEVMGIIGESGSGKSVGAYAVMRLIKSTGRIDSGSIRFEGRDVLGLSQRELEAFRGSEISMIFQDPLSCLDPMYTVGSQLTETLKSHGERSSAQAVSRSVAMLSSVGIRDAERVMRQYPFELSGGMRQRIMIAMALLCKPKLLIADEPTTALDVTIQDQIIELLRRLRAETGMAMIFITHNFGIVADICDAVSVMYGGIIVEQGPVDDLFYRPVHPYTKALHVAIPRVDERRADRLASIEGVPVDPLCPPKGCPFHPRCAFSMERCLEAPPPRTLITPEHSARCWLVAEGYETMGGEG